MRRDGRAEGGGAILMDEWRGRAVRAVCESHGSARQWQGAGEDKHHTGLTVSSNGALSVSYFHLEAKFSIFALSPNK